MNSTVPASSTKLAHGRRGAFSGNPSSSMNKPMPSNIPLHKGDFIAVLAKLENNEQPRWILGQVESNPYESDVDVRVWEKTREIPPSSAEMSPEIRKLVERVRERQLELAQSMDHASDLSAELRAKREGILNEMSDANAYVQESQAIMNAARSDVERIPDRHWQELKSYRIAPDMVAVVLRAVMLLLCEDNARTWPQMQKVLRDINFKSRITSYNAEMRLSPERREFIMRECVSRRSFRYDRAMQGSLAMGPIYFWVLAQLDCGEAFVQKHKLDKERLARQRDLRAMLREVNTHAARISEHNAIMDDLDDEIRLWFQKASAVASPASSPWRGEGAVTARYRSSFAGKEDKMYLKPAYHDWKPTNRVLTILRSTVLCDFGPLTSQESSRGLSGGLDEAKVRKLDDAILRRLNRPIVGDTRDEDRHLERNILKPTVVEEERSEEDDHSEADRAAAKWASLMRSFEGKQWQDVLERRRADVVDIFADESARCLHVPRDHVTVSDLSETLPIIVSFEVCHSGRRDTQDLQDAVETYPYPRLRRLYEEEESKLHAYDEEPSTMGQTRDLSSQSYDGHVTDLPPATFAGLLWEECLHAKRPEISQAFSVETAEALNVSPQDVVVQTMKASPDGLEVFYEVFECPHKTTETLHRVSECEYPKLWQLYNKFTELHKLQQMGVYDKTFEGSDWRRVVTNRRAELEESFIRDEAECLKVMPNQVHIRSVHAADDGLTVRYDVASTVKLSNEAVDSTASYPYPHMWALYEDADGIVTSHEIGFEGDGWEAVVRDNYDELQRRFIRCTSDFLGLKDEDILRLRFSIGSLFANFDLRHPSAMTEHDINEKLSQCLYLPVWELLPLPDETEASREETVEPVGVKSGFHELAFEGAIWNKMLEVHKTRIQHAVLADTRDALKDDTDPQDVSVNKMEYAAEDESLIATVEVKGCPAGTDSVQKRLEHHSFPTVWGLLRDLTEVTPKPTPQPTPAAAAPVTRELPAEPAREDHYSSILEQRFPGDDWDLVVDNDPVGLRVAFREDVAAALGICPEDVEVVDTRIGSLIVAYRVKNPKMSDEALKERLRKDYTFPKVESLYKSRASYRNLARTGTSQGSPRPLMESSLPRLSACKPFTGPEWADLVKYHYPAVERAAIRDIAAARDVPEAEIRVLPVQLIPVGERDGPGMLIPYDVLPRDEHETQPIFTREAANYDFPLVRGLPHEIPRNKMTDKYTVHFDADGWAYVVRRRRWELARALSDDTGEACDISPDDVVDVEFHVDPDALTADMCITHDKNISRNQIQEALFLSPFRRVWELYEQYSKAGLLTREFRGEGWRAVNELKGDELRRAFANDTAKALDLSRLEIDVQEVGTSHAGCCFTYFVRGSSLSADEINSSSASYLYPEVWALYELHGRVAQPQNVKDNKTFSGERWRGILATRRQAVSHAFRQDAANALHRDMEDITVPSIEANEACLTVHYRVKADNTQQPIASEEEVKQVLDHYSYPLLWEEYRREESMSLSDADHSTAVFHRRFPGERWNHVLEKRRRDAEAAFAKGVADSVGVPSHDVEIVDMRVGSLLVDYRIHNPPCKDEDADDAVQKHNFPELMALHPTTPPPVSDRNFYNVSQAPMIRDYEVGFDGDKWAQVVRNHHAELEEAFRLDTAQCLNADPAELHNIAFAITHQMIGYFGLRDDFKNLQAFEVDNELRAFSYPRVWALYPTSTEVLARAADENYPVITNHGIHFDGDAWNPVAQMESDRLRTAVTQDVAECLQLPLRDVVGTNFHVTPYKALNAYVKVQHSSLLPIEEIKRKLAAFAYPRVWALYNPVIKRDGDTLRQCFPGDRWKNVLQCNFEGVEGAFQNDISHMLTLPVSYCQVRHMNATNKELQVDYTVSGDSFTPDQLRARASADAFPQVWACYRNADRIPHVCKLTFPGELWERIGSQTNFRPQVEEAFYADILTCFAHKEDVQLDHVVTSDQHSGRLTIDFTSTATQRDYTISREKMKTCEYPAIWELYRLAADRLPSPPSPQQQQQREISPPRSVIPIYRTTLHEVTFEGEDWDYVWHQHQPLACDIFEEEVAQALKVRRQDVSSTFMTAHSDGMKLRTAVNHPSELSTDEIMYHLKTHEYSRLWALYQPPPRPAIQTDTLLTFEGQDWEYVLSQRSADVREAVVQDTKKALSLSSDDVRDVQIRGDRNGMHARVLLHGVSKTEADELHRYPYHQVWNLYMRAPPRQINGQRRFQQDWNEVIKRDKRFHPRLQTAFLDDVADLMGLQHLRGEASVTNVKTEIPNGNLLVSYSLCHTDLMDEATTYDVMDRGQFPRVWDLYSLLCATSGDMHRRFDGKRWGDVLANRRPDVEDAFAKGVSDAVGVPKKDVEIINMLTGSLLVDYRLHNPSVKDDELDYRVKNHGFPELMALHPATPRVYKPPAYVPPPTVTSQHTIPFPGDNWRAVDAEKHNEIERALQNGVCTACGVRPNEVTVLTLQQKPDVMNGVVLVTHQTSRDESSIASLLQQYPFNEVWALYEEKKPVTPIQVVSASRSIPRSSSAYGSGPVMVFPGEHWESIVQQHRTAVRSAFIQDTSDELRCPEREVVVQSLFTSNKGLSVNYIVNNGESVDNNARQLNNAPYTNLWRLYDQYGVQSRKPSTRTSSLMPPAPLVAREISPPAPRYVTHEIHFEGTEWPHVVEQRNYDLIKAIEADSADALHQPIKDVSSPTFSYTKNQLSSRIQVLAGTRTPYQEQQVLEKYPFPRVWALLEDVTHAAKRRRSVVNFTPTPVDTYTPWQERRFEGSAWHIPLQDSRGRLEQAFRDDAAQALRVSPDHIEIENMRIGSLLVTYRVRNSPYSDEETRRVIESDAFPRVHALYPQNPVTYEAFAPTPRFSVASGRATQTRSSTLVPPATVEYPPQRSYRESLQSNALTPEEMEAQREYQVATARAERARQVRDDAQRRAAEAEAEAARKAREAEEEERRLRDAAQRTRQLPELPVGGEEEELEEDQLTYLRRALAEARQERDRYQQIVESQSNRNSSRY